MERGLDCVEDSLNWRNWKHERLDGSTPAPLRQASIDRFTKDKDRFVFLLSTRAGGVGINLTAAQTIIIFDSDMNPQGDVQVRETLSRPFFLHSLPFTSFYRADESHLEFLVLQQR